MVNCPKHGHLTAVKKINVSKLEKYSKFGILDCYYCDECQKYYVDVNGIREGRFIKINGIPVVNIHKYCFLPQELYVMTKNDLKIRENNMHLESVSNFATQTFDDVNIPTKYSRDKNEYYIDDGIYKKYFYIIKQNNIKVNAYESALQRLKKHQDACIYAMKCYNDEILPLPNEFIVLTKQDLQELEKKKKLKFIYSYFTNYVDQVWLGAKYDQDRDEYYISDSTLKKYFYYFKYNRIEIAVMDYKTLQSLKKNEDIYDYYSTGYSQLKEYDHSLEFKNQYYADYPKKFIVVKEESLSVLEELRKLQTRDIFYLNRLDITDVFSKYDKETNKCYITDGTFRSCLDLFKKRNISVSVDDYYTLKKIEPYKEAYQYVLECGNPGLDSYDLDFYADNELTNQDYSGKKETRDSIDITNLKQNNKVAVAYNTANIRYNPYQYLPWLYMYNEGNKSILISDEVGLGKTIEAGILVSEELSRNTNSKVLIVCPAFLKFKWKEELFDKFNLRSSIYDLDNSNVSITILPLSKLNKFNQGDYEQYDMLIVDEAHYFKNSSSARYKHLSNLINKKSPSNRVFMTATPINNKEDDYDSIKKLLGNRFSTTSTTKRQAYINIPRRMIKEVYLDLSPYEQGVYDVTDDLDPFSGTIYRHIGASCLYALMQYAQKYSSNESEVKKELKAGLEELLEYDYDEEKDIEDMSSKLSKFHLDGQDSKLDKLIEVIDEIEDSKIIIFSHYIETVKYLKSELSNKYNCEYIYENNFSNHTVLTNKKNRFIDAKIWFEKQDSSKKTILICSDTCKEGIDLDAASCLINYDLPFNPSILEQRIGRIDRMCQKKNMKIFNFHVNNTYDDRLHMILSSKLLIIDYYSEYGIGNPLSIIENCASPFDKFISYFKKNTNISMSNDDFSVIKKILRKINITTPKKIKQEEILDILTKNKNKVIELFDEKEIDDLTDEQLKIQRDLLDKKLGFPKYSSETLSLDISSIRKIVQLLSETPSLRSRLSSIIIDYDTKIRDMEDTGNPMVIEEDDIKSSITFSSNAEDNSIFISRDTINLLKEQGGFVNEN